MKNNTRVKSITIKKSTTVGNVYITVSLEPNKMPAIIANIGKSGSDVRAMAEGLGRVVSLYLKSGGNKEEIIDQLSHIGSDRVGGEVVTLPHAIAEVLREVEFEK